MFERGSACPFGWGRPLCYLWGCVLSVSRTPGAVQAPSSVGGGRLAGAARPRPAAPLAGAAGHPLPQWAGDGSWRRGSARRAARPPPPARPGPPRPARPAGGWPAARHARPSPPRWPARCPSAQGPAAALCRGGRAGRGRGRGRGEALLLNGCAARHPPHGWPWPGPHVEQR